MPRFWPASMRRWSGPAAGSALSAGMDPRNIPAAGLRAGTGRIDGTHVLEAAAVAGRAREQHGGVAAGYHVLRQRDQAACREHADTTQNLTAIEPITAMLSRAIASRLGSTASLLPSQRASIRHSICRNAA